MFVNMPDSLSPLLTKVNREDCIDFLESKMKAQVENRFGKKSEMTDIGKDYIRMQMSAQSTWQMKVLALNDSTNIICTVSTVCAPACDSSIRFYTDDWKPLTTSLFITLPLMDDFLNAPDSTGVYKFDEARRSADMLLMKADFNKENTELTLTLTTPDYMSKETAEKLKPFLRRPGTPALLSYDGIQYQYMAPHLFTRPQFEYAETHLRILSGFYGVLRPFDGVLPYRLEMGARCSTPFCKNLYDFWGDSLYRTLTAGGEDTLLNLASAEYAKAVRPWVTPPVRWIDVTFGEADGDKVVEKGGYVKMARGEMVRFLAERNAETPEAAQGFDRLGYRFSPAHSTAASYVFLREGRAN